MTPTHLLIVHPEPTVRTLMASMLHSLGHPLLEAPSDRVAVRMLESDPAELVLAGADPGDPDALEFVSYLKRKHPRVPVVVVWSSGLPDRSREAIQHGAVSSLKFPLPATQLRAAVSQALGQPEPPGASAVHPARPHAAETSTNGNGHAHSNGNGNGHGELKPHLNGHGPIPPTAAPRYSASPMAAAPLIGDDPGWKQAIELAGTIAPSRAPVLIVGERGTGKTIVARHIHARSPRRDQPCVELSCATLKDAALEAELFGRRGLPGEPDWPGRLAQAHGGTLILDDVAALPTGIQYKLLRVLQAGEYEPVGSTVPARADVRLILTSDEDLAGLVESGLVRRDFHYRISVVTLKLPSLRGRYRDIEPLAEHFRARFAREIGREVGGFTPEAMVALRGHDWSGNVIELENVVERAVVQCRGHRIDRDHLSLAPRPAPPAPSAIGHGAVAQRRTARLGLVSLKEALEGPEKQIILEALEALNWNRQETARVLDINRTTLYKKMKKYGLLFDEPAWAN